MPAWLERAYRVLRDSKNGEPLLDGLWLARERAHAVLDAEGSWLGAVRRHLAASAAAGGREDDCRKELIAAHTAALHALRKKPIPHRDTIALAQFAITMLVEHPELPMLAVSALAWWSGFSTKMVSVRTLERLIARRF